MKRLLAIASLLSLLIAGLGAGFEVKRFGTTSDAAAANLERDVRTRFEARARQVRGLAEQVAREGPLVASAEAQPDDLPALFDRLQQLAHATSPGAISASVYVPVGPAGQYPHPRVE